MLLRRSIPWSAALRELGVVRHPVAARAAVHAARIEAIRAQGGARAKLWTTAGGFDRRAIMAYAVANARCERTNRPALTWQACMAGALTHAWACAHAARRAGSH